jgi:hypothetical protein
MGGRPLPLLQSDAEIAQRLCASVYGDSVPDGEQDYERALVTTASRNVLQAYWEQCDDLVGAVSEYWKVGWACTLHGVLCEKEVELRPRSGALGHPLGAVHAAPPLLAIRHTPCKGPL